MIWAGYRGLVLASRVGRAWRLAIGAWGVPRPAWGVPRPAWGCSVALGARAWSAARGGESRWGSPS